MRKPAARFREEDEAMASRARAKRADTSVLRIVWAPVLGWLRHLPEAGRVAHMASEEQSLMERRARLERELAAVEADLETLRARAAEQTAAAWTPEEIAAAKTTAC